MWYAGFMDAKKKSQFWVLVIALALITVIAGAVTHIDPLRDTSMTVMVLAFARYAYWVGYEDAERADRR